MKRSELIPAVFLCLNNVRISSRGEFVMYKRVLLKLSGEALAAPDFPFSTEVLESIGKQVKKISDMGIGVGIVVGGGNICR